MYYVSFLMSKGFCTVWTPKRLFKRLRSFFSSGEDTTHNLRDEEVFIGSAFRDFPLDVEGPIVVVNIERSTRKLRSLIRPRPRKRFLCLLPTTRDQ